MPLSSQRTGPNGELPEFVLRGPFGGIQSELPSEMIETLGFADTQNIMFIKGTARVRPALNPGTTQPKIVRIEDLVGFISEQTWTPVGGFPPDYPAGGFEPWMAIADFYARNGERRQCGITPSRLLYYDNGIWNEVIGALTGTSLSQMVWTVVGGTLCFCNGVDKVQIWDGIASSFTNASSNAVPARYLFELVNHLVAANTIEGGVPAYQRVRWTGAGDPTDWTSFNAGQTDLFNDLGPILGGLKLFQYGYLWQKWGIVQMIPTGIGTNPFAFQPLSAKSKGLLCPKSLCANGETTAFYVGNDNVYSFDGTQSTPVGDMPMGQGRGRLGARTRIFVDLQGIDLSTVLGFVTTAVNGVPYNAYWIIVPGRSVWVFNIDEGNWTRWTFSGNPTAIGVFAPVQTIRIMDLIGTIAQQLWTPATLRDDVPFDSVMIGFADGVDKLFNFSGWSEEPWSITTGQMSYGDDRHGSATKKIRMLYQDNGVAQIVLDMTNEDGQNQHNTYDNENFVPIGGVSVGKTVQKVIPVDLPGDFVILKLSGTPGQPFSFSMLSPVYSPSGEVSK
jgi:hypothetical protein